MVFAANPLRMRILPVLGIGGRLLGDFAGFRYRQSRKAVTPSVEVDWR
jgi:hypothetical protein